MRHIVKNCTRNLTYSEINIQAESSSLLEKLADCYHALVKKEILDILNNNQLDDIEYFMIEYEYGL